MQTKILLEGLNAI